MYNDEDDEEMEDIEEDDRQQNQQGEEEKERSPEEENEYRKSNNNMEEDSRANDNTPPFPNQKSTPSQQQPQASISSPQQHQRLVSSKRRGRGRLNIVDYGHDEAAMSPEAGESEIGSSDDLNFCIEHQVANGNFRGKTPPAAFQATPQSSDIELLQPETLKNAISESEGVEVVESVSVDDVDPLDKFFHRLQKPISLGSYTENQ